MQVDPTPSTSSADAGTSSKAVTDEMLTQFELDPVAAAYEGRARIVLLQHVASQSPALRGPALHLALLATVEWTLDVQLYEQLFQQYREFLNALEEGKVGSELAKSWYAGVKGTELAIDRPWLDKSRREAQQITDRLEVELRGYTTNLIKESIRMGHRDMAVHLHRIGDLPGAIRSYTKSRDFCTTSLHVLEMSAGIVQVALECGNYSHVRNYVLKGESALDALYVASAKPKGTAPVLLPGMVAPAPDANELAKEREHAENTERFRIANGVALMGAVAYDKAARSFCDKTPGEGASGGPNAFVPPAAHALYATLTALASFDRAEIRSSLLENPNLRAAFDQEPWAREVARAVVGARYREAWNGLMTNKARALLDPHLFNHVPALLSHIRSRLLCSYFAPYSSVALSTFADSFGCEVEGLKEEVIHLIGQGRMPARVDAREGRLVKKDQDPREKAFKRALEQGELITKRVKASQLRMKLIQAELVVKAPKQSHASEVA